MAKATFIIMTYLFILLISLMINHIEAFGSSDKVLLKELNVVTLYHGQMTTARRSSPIPQMKCVGGNAGCESFIPQVVQCYNRGSDGFDVQWECKTDLDEDYRLGKVELSCEGYDYPDDPYILKGSCGMEYTLDLTRAGHGRQHDHQYYSDKQQHSSYSHSHPSSHKKPGSVFGNLISLAVVGVIMYAIYHTCLSGNHSSGRGTGPDYPGGPRGGSSGYNPGPPPPPGFRDEYMPGGGCSSNFGSQGTFGSSYPRQNNAGGGFWSGMATGGLLGYMFGGRNNNRAPNTGWGSGWGSGSGSAWGSGSSGSTYNRPSSSSGTRTASGFGGTRRR